MEPTLIRQGDVLLIPTTTTPDTTKQVDRENGAVVLAHGEATGHAHRIYDDTCELVTADQAAELYLLVHGTEPASLVHDEHDTLLIAPGTYRVVRQREYTPEEIRNVTD